MDQKTNKSSCPLKTKDVIKIALKSLQSLNKQHLRGHLQINKWRGGKYTAKYLFIMCCIKKHAGLTDVSHINKRKWERGPARNLIKLISYERSDNFFKIVWESKESKVQQRKYTMTLTKSTVFIWWQYHADYHIHIQYHGLGESYINCRAMLYFSLQWTERKITFWTIN